MDGFQIQSGDVFHLWCNVCVPQKYKFFVVAYVEPRLRYMLINSEPAAFQRQNTELMAHQLQLRVEEHSFLTHDSYLDCSQIMGGATAEELSAAHYAGVRIRIGSIAPEARKSLRTIAAESRVLTSRDKDKLLSSW